MKALFWALSALLCLSPASARAGSQIVIKFSHAVAPDTPKGKGALRFKELAQMI